MDDLRALAYGVIVAGFDGTTPPLSERFAGYILFARNIETVEQTRELNDVLRAGYVDDLPPILAVDQEGGRIMRLREDVTSILSAAELGERGDSDACYAFGHALAGDLQRAGFNLNFAPVLDLAIDPDNTVIGDRSFGSDPRRVTQLAGAFARGMRANNVAVTYKHFPGHGSTSIDSHVDVPVIDVDEKTFRNRDMQPFRKLLSQGDCSVMAGHVIVRAFDPYRPASLSQIWLTDILRNEFGFEGVCFTDCLQMDAIAKDVGTVAAAPRAIAAGADCITISRGLDVARACAEAIVDAVASGVLTKGRLQEAYQRVQALRATF